MILAAATNESTFAKILPLILAILLIFVIPMLMRRYGWEVEDVFRLLFGRLRKQDYSAVKKNTPHKREPYQTNGRSADLKGLVSTLLIFARRQKLGLVYPGTVRDGQKTANLLALLVTRESVIGFNCFGYGGTITSGKGNGPWNQHMNGNDIQIPNPVKGNEEQYTLVRRVMDRNGMKGIPLEIIAVFTASSVQLVIPKEAKVMTPQEAITYLKEKVAGEDNKIDPGLVSRQLNEHVVRIRASAGK